MNATVLLLAAVSLRSVEKHDCGAKALYTALVAKAIQCDVATIEGEIDRVSGTDEGDSLAALRDAATRFGVRPLMVRFQDRNVRHLPPGAIVHLLRESKGHFLVYLGESDDGVVLADAPIPPYVVKREGFHAQWSGYALLLFDSPEEAARFQECSGRAGWPLWGGLGVLLLLSAAMVVGWCRSKIVRRLRRFQYAQLGVLLLLVGCEYPAAKETEDSFPCDILPSPRVDAGFVPPEGKKVVITLVNRTDGGVEIGDENVKASCGCTKVVAPGVIPLGRSASLILHLEGQRQPVVRTSKIFVRTSTGHTRTIRLNYFTGALPGMTPRVVVLPESSSAGSFATTTVWVNGALGSIVELNPASGSALSFEVLDGDGYGRRSANSVEVVQSGLIGVHMAVRSNPGIIPKRGKGCLKVRSAEATHEVEYGYVASDGPSVVVYPCEANFVSGEDALGQRRVVIVKGSFAGECKIAHCPNFVSADLRRLSEDTWKLEMILRSGPAVPGSEDNLRLSCRTDSGQTCDGVCKVKVLAQTGDLLLPR